MLRRDLLTKLALGLGISGMLLALPGAAVAASAAQLTSDAKAALNKLYASNPQAKQLGGQAVGILVFPSIVKAGIGVSGQYGEGVMFKGGKPSAYYNSAGAAFGIQAGAQKYGYAMFFLSEETLKYLDSSQGFEVGVGPSVVVADKGTAKTTTTTTAKDKIYAFIFDQSGAMASIGLQGSKITRIQK